MTDLILTDPAALNIVVLKESDDPPVRVGDVSPVREEWRVVRYNWAVEGQTTITIEYRDGWQKIVTVYVILNAENGDDWQPASTMPDWAARQHRRVCKVESCRISRSGEWLEPYTEEQGWKIYLGTDWLGGTREEAEAIYERYRCDCSLAFDYEGGEVGARAHLLGPRNGTYRQVIIGDTVYRDGDGFQVRRVSECAM